MARIEAQTLNFRQYTAAEGLPQAQVMGMYQDRLGYMWFATYGGLSRFDGNQFRTYTKDDGLSSNSVFDMVEDERGRMFIATSGGLCIREKGNFRCRRQTDGLVSDNARTVTLDGKGGVWVGTLVGLSHLHDGKITNYTMADGLPAERVIRVVVDSAGRVWVATPKGIVTQEGERFVLDEKTLPGDSAVQFIAPARGGLLIGVEGHLYLRHGDLITPIADGQIPSATPFFDGIVDRNGTIWVAMRMASCASRMDASTTSGARTVSCRISSSASWWIAKVTCGSAPRVARANTRRVRSARTRRTKGCRARSCATWKWTSRVACGWVRATASPFAKENASGRSRCLTPSIRASTVWPASRMEACSSACVMDSYGIATGRTQFYGEKEGLARRGRVLSSARRKGWRLDLGTERGLARWENGRITPFGPDEITKTGVISMALDGRGRLWLGRVAGGVAILDGDSARVIGPKEGGTRSDDLGSARSTRKGYMWAGTNGDGALRFDGRHGVAASRFAKASSSNFIWQILGDSRGHVWLFGNQGIDRFSGEELTHYGRGDGLIDLEGTASASFEDRDGNLWFGTGAGLLRYSEGLSVVKPIAPPIFIEETTLNGEQIPSSAAAEPSRLHRGAVRIRVLVADVPRRVVGSVSLPPRRHERRLVRADVRPQHHVCGLGTGSLSLRGRRTEREGSESRACDAVVRHHTRLLANVVVPHPRHARLVRHGGGAAVVPRSLAASESVGGCRRSSRGHTHELAEKNARLESSNRDLEHFAYVASHDLQEPLRKIQAFSDRVTKQYASKLDDQGRDYLQRMNGAAARMQRLIEALLSLSRITTKKKEAELIDLAPLVHEVLGDLEVRIQSTGGKVTVGELPRIEGDPVQIRQLFQNLIGNALKFHKPGEAPQVRGVRAAPVAGPGGDLRRGQRHRLRQEGCGARLPAVPSASRTVGVRGHRYRPNDLSEDRGTARRNHSRGEHAR